MLLVICPNQLKEIWRKDVGDGAEIISYAYARRNVGTICELLKSRPALVIFDELKASVSGSKTRATVMAIAAVAKRRIVLT